MSSVEAERVQEHGVSTTHNNAHDASHPRWDFRAESAIWFGTEAVEPNMMAFAFDLSKWLRRELHQIVVFNRGAEHAPGAPTNPYTYHVAAHFGLIVSAISAAMDFIESTEETPPFEAEARRLRLYNELVLESARFCEAAIKQMLYCTSIPESDYKNRSLGQLMAADCKPCRKAGSPHHYSLLGALACQYYQCQVFDACGFDHLALVNRRRNTDAAHASQAGMNVRTALESRADLALALTEVGNDLEHMARHIGDIERSMIREVRLLIARKPNMPSPDEFLAIPAKPRALVLR